MSSLEIGSTLHERYEILEQIGRGGFGAVYRAKDLSLGRICAVKENLNDTDEASRQFHREASLLAGLNHQSLPRVTDHFRIDGQGQYLVMDFINGKSLQQLLTEEKGPLDEDDIAKWMIQVTQALHYLHNRQPPIIHRDIKPANIIVNQNGRAILVDFGISKVVESGGQTTMGARAITPGFSPPEQYGVSSTDNRSDLYSLGATMYACITGKNPPESIQMMMGQASLPEPRSLNNTISRPLSDVILHSMILAMGSRYQSAVEMEGALKQATTEPLPVAEQSAVEENLQNEFAPTIDQPSLSSQPSPPPSHSASRPKSAPISSQSSASQPTPSKKIKKKNSLPIWAWVIIVTGGLIIFCSAAFLGLGFYLQSLETDPVTGENNNGEAPILNDSQPIEVDGIVINWRVGGNEYLATDANLIGQRMGNFTVDRQSGKTYGVTGDSLVVFDPAGNQIDSAPFSESFSTQDITIGPDGNLYVLDKFASENFIRVFSPDLRFLREIGVQNTGEEGQAGISSAPINLVFGPDGLLWMLDYKLSETLGYDKLVKIDPETGEEVDFIQIDTDISISDQLVRGADGKLYLLFGRDAIVFEVNEQFEPVVEIAVPNASFVDSVGISADGTLLAGVSQDQVLIEFDRSGTLIRQFGTRSEESDVAYPAGIFYNIEKIEYFNDNLFLLDESVTYSYIVSIFP